MYAAVTVQHPRPRRPRLVVILELHLRYPMVTELRAVAHFELWEARLESLEPLIGCHKICLAPYSYVNAS